MFEKLIWHEDRVKCGDLVFRLESLESAKDKSVEQGLVLFKNKELFDEYERWFSAANPPRNNILELGIWKGGSIAFWFECLRPRKHVAIDIAVREDSPYFQQYVTSRSLEDRIKTYWETSQADADRLREIISKEFDGPLDLVIDDASHLYQPTKAGFETVFPLIRPGGFYIIEDWAWAHAKVHWGNPYFARESKSLTDLTIELVELKGSSPVIASIAVWYGFIAVERGMIDPLHVNQFSVEQQIFRRPKPPTTKPGLFRRIIARLPQPRRRRRT
jgi:hypothetical protein